MRSFASWIIAFSEVLGFERKGTQVAVVSDIKLSSRYSAKVGSSEGDVEWTVEGVETEKEAVFFELRYIKHQHLIRNISLKLKTRQVHSIPFEITFWGFGRVDSLSHGRDTG